MYQISPCLALTMCVLISLEASGDVVERRGMEPAVEGRITTVDDAGVTISSELRAVHFIPWDRVRSVQTELADPRLGPFAEVAEDLWRARSRVERRDYRLAEPLLERLFEQYRGQTHETALVVAEGLLRCRLDRGDNAAAVIPALETARIRLAGVCTHSYSMLPEALDEETALCPHLPPVWVPGRSLEKLARDLADYDAQGNEVIQATAQAYRRAVLLQTGAAPGEQPGSVTPDQEGVELLTLLADCRSPDPDSRLAASEKLARRSSSPGDWEEAWSRFHTGLALLSEKKILPREQGMVSLLHLPARFSATQPYLAGLALAVVAETLEAEGEQEAADRMWAELATRHPGHPVHRAIADGIQIRSIIATEEEES